MNGLPIAPHWDVTGNPVPDCTGRYELTEAYNNKDCYKRKDSAYFIWYYPPDDIYYVSNILGDTSEDAWYRVKTIEGTYLPFPKVTGVPVFAKTTYEPPDDYQIPKL